MYAATTIKVRCIAALAAVPSSFRTLVERDSISVANMAPPVFSHSI
jgi:hypothetical protein